MRRDLDIDCDPARARARAARPLAAEGDLPPLRVPRPARAASTSSTRRCPPRRWPVTGVEVPWREGELVVRGPRRLRGARRPRRGRDATTASSSGRGPARVEGELVVHDAKALRVDAADDTLLAAYLIEPGPRRRTSSTTSRPSTASSCPRRRRPTRRRRRSSRAPRRRAGSSTPLLERLEERGADARSTATSSCR